MLQMSSEQYGVVVSIPKIMYIGSGIVKMWSQTYNGLVLAHPVVSSAKCGYVLACAVLCLSVCLTVSLSVC